MSFRPNMDDDGGFGGFGDNSNSGFGDNNTDDADTGFGGFDDPAPAKLPKRKTSTRGMNLYAKSPMQKRQEEAAAMEYQEMLNKEQLKQADALDGFGGGDFDDQPASKSSKPNMWGQASNSNVVIPPFVPRDQRNQKVWDVGKIKKSLSDKTILAGTHGDFLIRETMKGDRHVVCVCDQKGLFEMYIRHLPIGGSKYMFMSREFDDLESIVKHLQRNALYNKAGLPLYIDKPCCPAN